MLTVSSVHLQRLSPLMKRSLSVPPFNIDPINCEHADARPAFYRRYIQKHRRQEMISAVCVFPEALLSPVVWRICFIMWNSPSLAGLPLQLCWKSFGTLITLSASLKHMGWEYCVRPILGGRLSTEVHCWEYLARLLLTAHEFGACERVRHNVTRC